MEKDCGQRDQAFLQQLQGDYQRIVQERKRSQEHMASASLQSAIEFKRVQGQMSEQRDYYEKLISEHVKRIGELQEMCRNLQNEESDKNRRQFRKYIESINEKEAEINNLRRLVASHKNKISVLQNEVININSTKDDLEIFVIKSFETIRTGMKEMDNTLGEFETEKMVIESRYRQLNEKVNLLLEQINELTERKKYVEENYEKLNGLYQASRNQCIELKFKIEKKKMKEAAESPFKQMNGAGLSAAKVEDELSDLIQSILEMPKQLVDRQTSLKQVEQYYNLNIELIDENNGLKQKLGRAEQVIDEYKIKYVAGYEDQLLKARQPSLYEYLKQKKERFMDFENTMEKIQAYIERRDDEINQILKTVSEKQIGCNCGKQVEIDKLQLDYEASVKKLEQLSEVNFKFKKQMVAAEKLISVYKTEIKDILSNDAKNRNKRKAPKKRCLACYLPIEKNEAIETCPDCQKPYHVNECINQHQCELNLMKLNESFSSVSRDF